MKHVVLSAAALFALAACAQAGTTRAAPNPEAAARRAVAGELADLMAANYVFPDIGQRYAEHLRTTAAAGAFDAAGSPETFAGQLQAELRSMHPDAHLRVRAEDPAAPGETALQRAQRRAGDALQGARWIADGVAYVAITILPEDEESQRQMAAFLDQYNGARALILDLRRCPGGSLEMMDVLLSRLFRTPTHLLNMDMRTDANAELAAEFDAVATMTRADGPAGMTRWQHWARPAANAGAWPSARVYVLTDATASACEHLALALQRTGRATLVGATTRGAGHFGGERTFASGAYDVWLPVGRTADPVTNDDWEGDGVTPSVAVAPTDALNHVLRELGSAPVREAQAAVAGPPGAVVQRVEAAPRGRRYGIAMSPPQGGEAFLTIFEVVAGEVAERAGLRAGDRILSLNGRAVSDIAPQEMPTIMRASPLVVVVDRGGQQVRFELSLD